MYLSPDAGLGINGSHPLARGLVGAWIYRGAQGRAMNHASPGIGDATPVNGPTIVGGRYGEATALVAGMNQHWSVGNPTPVRITGPLSLAVYYRLGALPSNLAGRQLLSKDGTGQRSYTFDLLRNDGTPASAGVRFYLNGGGAGLLVEGRNPVAGDERLAVATIDASGTGRLYINGRQVATSGTLGYPPADTTSNLLIGRRAFVGAEENFDGRIDFAMVWARDLSAGEVLALAEDPYAAWRQFQSQLPGVARSRIPIVIHRGRMGLGG